MKDVIAYEEKYLREPCEMHQVYYRRKKVLEIMKKYRHDKILEIGCGMEPLFEHFSDYKEMLIVEPVNSFVVNALEKSKKTNHNINRFI